MSDVTIVMHSGAFGPSEYDSAIDGMLRRIAVKASADPGGEWAEKYGTKATTPVFEMRPYCWCEEEACGVCNGETPNFRHIPSGLEVRWYKYIGRGVEVKHGATADLGEVERECMASIQAGAA